LIGTPIHEVKDYSMRRWLKSVSEITTDAEWKLFMVDNSANKEWYPKIHEYCKELNFTNYELISLPDMKDGDDFEPERLACSREVIREKLLKENYDYFWSWECDIICPPDTLMYLLKFTPDFDAIYHTYPPKGNTVENMEQDGIGCVLYTRKIFETFKFADNKVPLGADGRLIFEVMRKGWKIIEIHNIFKLEHLAV